MSKEDNKRLTALFTEAEFKCELFHMHPEKSPSPDGRNAAFYHKFWDLCCKDVCKAASKWLEEDKYPNMVNDTNIVLIPKCDHPNSIRDFRPIPL